MLKFISALLIRSLNIGTTSEKHSEANQQIVVANLFAMIGYSITFLMALSAFLRSDTLLGLSLLCASGLFFFAHCINGFQHRTKHPTHRISANIILYCLLILMIYLLYTGGHNNTGPLWVYIVPPVVFFFGGLKSGAIQLLLFAFLVAFILFVPDTLIGATQYDNDFKSRFYYSFLTVALLFGFYEFSRHKSIERIQSLSDQFEQQAMHDPLTNLPNRRGMKEFLVHEFNRSKRSGLPMSILLCDIDYFKKINDQHGHDAGDVVLVELSKLLTTNLRQQDKIARWGGEEFLFLLPETDGREAFAIAEKIRALVQDATFTHEHSEIKTTLSFGVKQVSLESTIDYSINVADQYLYQAKGMGRNMTLPTVGNKSTLSVV
ncbi:GGDEF domain-containing protein [Glaciecola sp. KUL10]|uniref:GGDEF domain-containing protein n=1 Tax=Glaciecola sp. (strain KUL10) TaxID=2161813 RepID=UPI000D78C373|nr:GGDEF domain-containing protein [Glaciecola sp. KUL10]